jgi:AcrR family transcriptional regulator
MYALPTRFERQARTCAELIDAAERLFTSHGVHAASVDAVAAEAGHTKGAVYSNFRSKEDLFFAVYGRRLEQRLREFEAILEAAPNVFEGLQETTRTAAPRSDSDDGWLAVFFEFWRMCRATASCSSASRSCTDGSSNRWTERLSGSPRSGARSFRRIRASWPPPATRCSSVSSSSDSRNLTSWTRNSAHACSGSLWMEEDSMGGSDQAPSGLRKRRPRERGAPRA